MIESSEPWFDYDGRYVVGFAPADRGRFPPSNVVLTLWNAKTGEVVREITGHKEIVVKAQLSPDSKSLLTSSYMPLGETATPSKDNSIRLWDIKTGKQRFMIPNASFGQFSRDGSRIFGFVKRRSGRLNGVACWDSSNGKAKFSTSFSHGEEAPERSKIHESLNAKRLLVSGPRTAIVFESMTGQKITPGDGYDTRGNDMLTANGEQIVSAGAKFVKFLSASEHRTINEVALPDGGGWVIGFFPNGNGFVGVSLEGTLMVYDRDVGKVVTPLFSVPYPQRNVLVSPEHQMAFVNFEEVAPESGALTPRAKAFDLRTLTLAWEGPGHVIGFQDNDRAVIRDGLAITVFNFSKRKVESRVQLKVGTGQARSE